jgi:hypothetical protein
MLRATNGLAMSNRERPPEPVMGVYQARGEMPGCPSGRRRNAPYFSRALTFDEQREEALPHPPQQIGGTGGRDGSQGYRQEIQGPPAATRLGCRRFFEGIEHYGIVSYFGTTRKLG